MDGKAFLGDVQMLVDSESLEMINEITEKPVEQGQEVAEHVRRLPTTISLSGVIAGEEASERFEKLQEYRDEAEVISFVGRQVLDDLVIQSFSPTEDNQILDGFRFTIVLKQIRRAEVRREEIAIPEVAPEVAEEADKGRDVAQDAEELDDMDDGRRRSVARKIWDGVSEGELRNLISDTLEGDE